MQQVQDAGVRVGVIPEKVSADQRGQDGHSGGSSAGILHPEPAATPGAQDCKSPGTLKKNFSYVVTDPSVVSPVHHTGEADL